MSALDFAARGLALSAAADRARLFTEFAGVHLPPNVDRIDTSGHTTPGLGAATYIDDALATAALASANPRACIVAADGRVFRLASTGDGHVTPEMLGCPPYAPGTNQQPYIQAAVDYVQAVGLSGVSFPKPVYELWAPQRTGYPAGNGYDFTNHTGEFIVISKPIQLIGRSGRRTKLHYKGPTGGSLLTDYQVVPVNSYGGDCIWRGAAVKITGTTVAWAQRPAEETLSHTLIRDIVFFSDAIGVKDKNWPALPASRDPSRVNCWDVSNKGIYCQQNVHSGDVRLENVDIRGFLGECFYMSFASQDQNWVGARYTIRNCRFADSNGQGLNPNGPMSLDCDGLVVENCSTAWEGIAGNDFSRVVNTHFRNCTDSAISGSGVMQTGFFATPMRADGSQPLCVVDLTVERCGELRVGGFVQGKIKLIDTPLAFVPYFTGSVYQQVKNNVLDVDLQVHALDLGNAVRFGGTGSAGDKLVSNNTVRLSISRTKEAIANNKKCVVVCNQSGSLGKNNYLYVRGHAVGIGSLSSVLDNYVAIIDEGLDCSTIGFPTVFDPGTTSTPEAGTGWLRPGTFTGGATYNNVNLPATTMYQHGAEIVIDHRDSGNTTKLLAIRDIGVERAIIGYKETAKFRLNLYKGKWELANPVPRRQVTASIDIASTALGAESGPYTIAAPGCRQWHSVAVNAPQSGTMPAGFAISTVRAETDHIRFWVRNIDGANPADPAAQSFTARWWVETS